MEEALVVASLRVLHAREPFIPNGKRHLQDATLPMIMLLTILFYCHIK